MTVFRYRDRGTAVHRLNPFAKLAWVASVFVLALIIDNPVFLLFLFLSTLAPVLAARVWVEWRGFMKFALFLCLAIIIVNALVSYHGTHVLAQAPFSLPIMGTPRITLEAIVFGAAMSLRLLAIVSAFAVLTFTVDPDDIMLSMIKLRLPYRSVLVTALSTRFVPTLIDDAERIRDGQRARALDLDKGNLFRRVRGSISVIVPLLSNSLDRAVQVAEAMEARAFGSGKKRTYYKDIAFGRLDAVTLAFGFAPCAFGILIVALGYGDYQYFPTFGGMDLGALEWSMLPILVLLTCSLALLALVKGRLELD